MRTRGDPIAGRAHAAWRRLCRLRIKATLVLSGVVLIATGLSATMYVRLARNIAWEESEWRARQAATMLSVASAGPIIAGDRGALLGIAEQLVPQRNVRYVAFADPAGRVLAGAQRGEGHLSKLLFDQGLSIPIAPLEAPMLMNEGNEQRLDVTFPVFRTATPEDPQHPEPVLGFVRLGLSLEDANQRVSNMIWQVAGIAVLIALLMVPLGFGLVHRIAAPLGALAAASREWAAGRLEKRVRLNRRDEIGDLAAAFNSMADDLATSRNDLLAFNAELEDRITARTFQLTEVNRQLRQEMGEKEDFLRTVSHDLNAPLRNVAGMVGLLRTRHATGLTAQAANLLERIDHNVQHELELINELLELSRIRTRRDAAQRVDLDTEVRGIAARFEYELAAKNIEFAIARPLPVVWAEKLRMQQLFQNLIDNAIKYTDATHKGPGDARPQIVVSWQERGDFVEFRVADNGIGVESRDRDRVFYVFRRAKNGFVAKTPGKGVGLANCKCIVQNYGGRIWVEPNPDGGSIFCLTMDRAKIALAAESEPHGVAVRPATAMAFSA